MDNILFPSLEILIKYINSVKNVHCTHCEKTHMTHAHYTYSSIRYIHNTLTSAHGVLITYLLYQPVHIHVPTLTYM